MPSVRFTLDEAQHAADTWGANCGPGALAAIMGMTLDEVRPHMGDFERKGYTNPTLMFAALKGICPGRYATKPLRTAGRAPWDWPRYGLCRVQWEGPWTAPGVPIRVRYRHTHWIGSSASSNSNISVFDINAMCDGGWLPLREWSDELVPWLLKQTSPKANGKWHITHAIEVEQTPSPAATMTDDRDSSVSRISRSTPHAAGGDLSFSDPDRQEQQ